MDFNLFKKDLRKTNLIVLISSLVCLLIGIVLILSLDLDLKFYKIPVGVLIVVNYLFVGLLIVILNHLKTYITFSFLYVTYKEKKTDLTSQKSKFEVNLWAQVILFIVTIMLYFIELTTTIAPFENNWILAARQNWWIVLILITTDVFIYEFSLFFSAYLFNHNPMIKQAIAN